MVKVGLNDFFGVPFPLVLADRFFHIYTDSTGAMKLNVFRWDEGLREPFCEVEGSEPVEENIETNPTGIVTFGEADGGFLFKFRPKPGVSQIFGHVPIGGEVRVHINDHSIRILRGTQPMATMTRNQVFGFAIGLHVQADGSWALGSNVLPPGMQLERSLR